jgi:excinuclease UvrABC nuclease subunit
MACCPYDFLSRFRLKNINDIPDGAHGIYGLWYRRRCIYIGKACDQTIATRLQQHWSYSHNSYLNLWLAAKAREMRFAYKVIEDPVLIGQFEKFYIRKFQPITNAVRYD